MKGFFLLLLLTGVVFFGALGEYVCGRIILPEMGLHVPDYWSWFWFMVWATVFSVVIYIAKAIIKEI